MTQCHGLPLFCFLFAPLALSLAMPAAAESEDEDEANPPPLEEIVVTGSRIKRSDFTSASPITVLTGQSLMESGFPDLGEALRSQAAAGTNGFNQSSLLAGGGATSASLRNIGTGRVLVLINGKRVARFADAGTNLSVDLTFVPQSMIDRVEILRDGASAAYGADAISGVINVILKESFEGVEAGVSTGISGEGDAERYTAEFAMGTTSDRGSMVIGGEYRYTNNLPQVDRDWAFPTVTSVGATTARDGTFFSPGGVFFGSTGTFCTQPKALGGDEIANVFPNCPSFAPGQAVSRPEDVVPRRYDYGLGQDLWGQSEVYSFAGYGVHQVMEGVEGFIEVQYAKRQSQFSLDGGPSIGTVSIPQGWVVPGSNPHNPYGTGNLNIRPTSTIGRRINDHESDTLRLVVGLRGDIVADNLLDGWNWELSHLHTRVDADLFTNSSWNLARANTLSDPDLCAADSICSQAVNPSGALDALRPGNWSQDEIAYLRQNAIARSEFQTSGWLAMATGPVLEVPAGEVSAAFGFETRTDRGFHKPDPVTESGESVSSQRFTTKGDFTVHELFGEVDVPLLAGLPGFDSLTLNAQARWSDYSSFGDETVWRVGLNWQVVADVRLRSTMSTAYRAPEVTELFGGGGVGFHFFSHPCASGSTDRSPGNNVDQNCLLAGIGPGAFQASNQYPVLSGGNPDLETETADTSAIGLVLTPSFLSGFSMSVDFWDIKIENMVASVTSDSIVDNCFRGPVGLTAPQCDRFTTVVTQAGIGVQGLTNQASNFAEASASGYDLGVRHETNGPMGTYVTLDLNGAYVRRHTLYPGVGGAHERGSVPRIKANVQAKVDWRSFDFSWLTRYIHGMKDPRFDGNNAFGYERVKAHMEHDVRVAWNLNEYRVLLGVNNLFDNDPPYVFSTGANTDLFLYRPIGRYIFLRVSARM